MTVVRGRTIWWQISTGGGTRPLWARNGQELFYLAPTGTTNAALMRVPIEHQGTFTAGVPTKLFEGRYYFTNSAGSTGEGCTYDVSPDGQRFLMVKPDGGSEQSPAPVNLVVVLNWLEELKRLVPR